MKKFTILLIIICTASVIAAGYYKLDSRKQKDINPPQLTVAESIITLPYDADEEQLMQGITAIDDQDGDVTKNIVIESVRKKTDGMDNEFLITYVCFDSSNNIGRISRTLFYEDYQPPHFALSSDLRFPLNSSVNLYDYVSAYDVLDDNISPFITIEGAWDLAEVTAPGIYPFEITVTNRAGDTASLSVNVEMYENTYEEQSFRPKIMLNQYMVYLKQGQKFRSEDYLDYVYDGKRYSIDFGPMVEKTVNGQTKTITQKEAEGAPGNWLNASRITAVTDLDVNRTGCYIVRYKYVSSGTGYEGSTNLIVVVE